MDCHQLIYKPYKTVNPYERFIKKQREKEASQKKELFYAEILKFTSSRYPKEFLLELEKQINPFEYSLETLRALVLEQYPDLPEDVVNESVEYIFNKKARQATMVRESETIIEDGDEYIINGRKLIKEDFTYSFHKPQLDSSPLGETSRDMMLGKTSQGELTKRSGDKPDPFDPFKKSGGNSSPRPTDRAILSSRKNVASMYRNQLFNALIAEQIEKESQRHKNINTIFQDEPEDILIREDSPRKPAVTDRSAKSGLNNESFPRFKDKDILIPVEGCETGRTEMEELNYLLSEISMICEEKEGITNRSDRGMYTMKISKKNMENLYNMQGSLKMETIKRAASRILAEYS